MIKSTIKGEYRLSVFNPETGETRDTGWFSNLITNSGLDAFGNNNNPTASTVSSLQVGSSGTTPAFTDSSLGSLVVSGGCGAARGDWNDTLRCYEAIYSTTYAQGAAAGNLAEVGATGAFGFVSRALILDGGGAPTVLVVSSIDILTVQWKLQVFPAASDSTGTTVLAGITYNWTARPIGLRTSCYINTSNPAFGSTLPYASGPIYWSAAALGTVTTSATGTATAGVTRSRATYVAGNHYVDVSYTFPISTANGNIASISGVTGLANNDTGGGVGTGLGYYQFGFSPAIPKDNTKVLTLTLRFGWGR